MTDDQVKDAVATAIKSVRSEDPPLDFDIAHERSTAHRLAVHLEPHFATWNVDCEYDRDGQLQKFLMTIKQCSMERRTDKIIPDIIVHHRRSDGTDHNLLVVELKKSAKEDPCDKRKLELLTDTDERYKYQIGLFVNIDGGKFSCTWYKNGAQLPGSIRSAAQEKQ